MSSLKKPSDTVAAIKRGLTAPPKGEFVDWYDDQERARERQAAEAKPAERWPARISMTASREMKRQLEAARIDDGIEVTARLRAMIALWAEDPQLRARVDEKATHLR